MLVQTTIILEVGLDGKLPHDRPAPKKGFVPLTHEVPHELRISPSHGGSKHMGSNEHSSRVVDRNKRFLKHVGRKQNEKETL